MCTSDVSFAMSDGLNKALELLERPGLSGVSVVSSIRLVRFPGWKLAPSQNSRVNSI